MIKVQKFVVNPLQENSFILSDDSGECIFIDPGFYFDEEFEEIKNFVQKNSLIPVKIVNTHCHFDHIMGVEFIRKEYKIPFIVHKDDTFWVERAVDQASMFGFEMNPVSPPDMYFEDEGKLSFGNSEIEVIHVPGHSPGHVVLYDKETHQMIGGDVLFYGSIGRTDLPGGDHHTLISSIKNRLLVLPDNTKVFCGHGPETTIGFEKTTNPFLN